MKKKKKKSVMLEGKKDGKHDTFHELGVADLRRDQGGPWPPQFFLYLYLLIYNLKYIFQKINICNIFYIFNILINLYTFIFINK